MKMILKLRKRDYIAIVGIFLIAVVLIAGGATCTSYTMKVYPVVPTLGGWTIPTAGTSTLCAPGTTPVTIIATPNTGQGYQFAIWKAVPAVTFHTENTLSTWFTMPNYNVNITAYFVRLLDHFKCYTVLNSSYIERVVSLTDQFLTVNNATVTQAQFFCNPVQKLYNNVTTNITHPDYHLTVYNITTGSQPQTWQVEVVNQFGDQNLTVSGPVALAVPTWKLSPGNHTPPAGLDHFLLYEVIGGYMNVTVGLNDEFDNKTQVFIYRPLFFANPVQKKYGNITINITDPYAHLVFYGIRAGDFWQVVQVNNQFGNQTLLVGNPALLAVPSLKLNYYQPIP
jgi:hypothetical protein